MPFTLGQRWISDTESELGLGTVVAVDARTVTLLFPSTGENRLYARSDSPVTRVMFNPGDTITSHDGWQMQVEEVKEENIVVPDLPHQNNKQVVTNPNPKRRGVVRISTFE